MDCWNFLKLNPTKDKREIKRAYSKLLPVYHPEKDHDGFMRLRQAYEEAVRWAEQEETEKENLTPVDIWMQKVEETYCNFKDRLDVERWKELLDEDVCIAIDSSNECNERLLIYLADHILVPHEVLQVLGDYFHWESRREQLCEVFPPNYIDYLCANAKYPDNFRYLLLDTSLDIDYDAFLEDYYRLEREVQNGNKEEVQKLLEDIPKYGVKHPDLLEMQMRGYLLLENREQVQKICDELKELAPDDEHTFHCLARCNLELCNYELALEYYDRILEQKEEHVGAWMGKAACYRELKQFDKALELAQKAQDKVPYDGYVRNFLVILNEDMVASKKEEYEANPSNTRCQYEYCKVLADAYRFEEAVEILKHISPEELLEQEYCELCSRVYMDMENQNCEKAIPYLERLIELEPKKQVYYEDLGYCYGEAGRLEEAKAIYAKARELDETSPRIYYRLAQIYIKEKQYEKAVAVCDTGLKYNDQIPNLYHFKAEAYYYLREYGRALELCDRAISILPYVDTYEIKAKIFNDCEEYEEVEEMLKDMVQSDFMSDMLYAQLARAKRRMGKVEEATAILSEAIARNSMEAEIYYQRGILYFSEEAGESETTAYENAVTMAEKALELDKEFVFEHLLLKNHSLLRLNRTVEAIEEYRKYEQKGHLNEQMALAVGDLYMEMQEFKEGIRYYEKAVEMNANSYSAHGRLCDAYMEEERYEDALREVNLQLDMEPSDYYYIDRGIILNELGDRKSAEENYRLALEENEENCYGWGNLGFVLRDRGELLEALHAFEKAIHYEHPNPVNYYEAAKICRRLGNSDKAADYLQKLADMGEKRYSSMLLLADIYAEMGFQEKSVEIYKEMEQQCQEDKVSILVHWADVYKHIGNYKTMEGVWKERASREERKSFSFYKYMGGYYLEYQDNEKKALKYYKKAYDIQPKDGYVCSQLGVIYERMGKTDKAQQMYREAYILDLDSIRNNEATDPCAFDCLGMDYAWLGNYDTAAQYFYKAIYYGPICEHCSMAECYEVFYDIGDAMERKATAMQNKVELESDEASLRQWIGECRKWINDYYNGELENTFYIPNSDIVEQLEQFLKDYEASVTYEACVKMAYKYYRKAREKRPDKYKYQRAVERLKNLVNKV